uniref:Uncharacterized protein n=1 Tax=Oryza sativa subsp. japonica TaxID=39947 RepID=Q6YVE0_ORYSJ|nr:hypothetical protein [Oryza sativa Japonica Group]BAD32060.1 hypothetical protein [Oryza sativa Japonica Group]
MWDPPVILLSLFLSLFSLYLFLSLTRVERRLAYGAHGRWWAAAADAARWPLHECGDEEFRWGGGRYGKRRSSGHSLPNSNSSLISLSLSLSHMFGRPAVAMEAEADVRRVTVAEADRAAGCGGGGAARPGSERQRRRRSGGRLQRRRRTGRSAAKTRWKSRPLSLRPAPLRTEKDAAVCSLCRRRWRVQAPPRRDGGKEKEESCHGPALPLPLAVHAPTVLRRPPPVMRAVRQPPLDPREREEERERR